jgi:hypothetical protein
MLAGEESSHGYLSMENEVAGRKHPNLLSRILAQRLFVHHTIMYVTIFSQPLPSSLLIYRLISE